MSETSVPTRRQPMEPVHEAYSFACLNCGFVWEQAYEIEHSVDYNGRMVYRYRANGVPVASPLTHPGCPGCGGEHVRIMAAGRVATVAENWHPHKPEAHTEADAEATAEPKAETPPPADRRRHFHLPFHWHRDR
ncbi:hypothetical protein [Streptacidiphilus rugosus]|uniref:hypothetical protein n=1 Tax=Streptacidiphilus rugosus TaxID=405783 RepID=UPI000A006921|nr:hypothetical protein [Streptacidiphilus rugosus]